MSVIVRMEMPWDCTFCPMAHWDCQSELAGCNAVNGKRYAKPTDEFWNKGRPSWCPIVGVLPEQHGDLIDRDALLKECYPDDEFDAHVIYADDIHKAKAVVSASERSETNGNATTPNTKWESITIKTGNKASDFWT